MRWLYKLEYKYGRYHIRNLMTIIVAGMAFVYLLQMMMPSIPIVSYLAFSRRLIMQGQVWRLISFILVPPGMSGSMWGGFMTFIALYFYFMMGRNLESVWGGFKLNVYYFIGILGAIAAGFLTGIGSNSYLNASLFLAFATIAPDTTFLLFFILPIKAKWLAIAYAVLTAVELVNSFFLGMSVGLASLVALAFSLLNYLLFFGGTLVNSIKEQARIAKNRRNWQNRNR